MSAETTSTSIVVFSRIKTGLMVEIDSSENEQFPASFGFSPNIASDVKAWECALEWFALDETQLDILGSKVMRHTTLTYPELVDLVASTWTIHDWMNEEGSHKDYILSLMSKIRITE